MAGKKLREFAPQESFMSLGEAEKISALHRGFMVLFMRGQRLRAEIARLSKRVEEIENGGRKKHP